ncbi:MAG: peptidylprolyl isomerase [Candidatus Deianiraeaceae bacterium]|jgi:peptidylprolyl isomerase
MLKERFFSSHILSIVIVSLFSISLFSFASMKTPISPVNIQDYENIVYLKLKDGVVVIELLPEKAPKHVQRIKQLVRTGFYDNLVFHRVIDGFMAQTGDPQGNGTGGSGQNIVAEFSDIPHKRGVVSMARAQDPNSADSQFFIVLKDSPFLDGQYTVFGRVVSGMDFVDNIKKGNPTQNGTVLNPDKIFSMAISSDVEALKLKKTL